MKAQGSFLLLVSLSLSPFRSLFLFLVKILDPASLGQCHPLAARPLEKQIHSSFGLYDGYYVPSTRNKDVGKVYDGILPPAMTQGSDSCDLRGQGKTERMARQSTWVSNSLLEYQEDPKTAAGYSESRLERRIRDRTQQLVLTRSSILSMPSGQ